MGLNHVTLSAFNLQQATKVALLLFLLLQFVSGFTIRDPDAFRNTLNKREVFMGLKLQCQAHPRNCIGGYQFKRKRNFEPSPQINEDKGSIDIYDDGLSLEDFLKKIRPPQITCQNHPRNCPPPTGRRSSGNSTGKRTVAAALSDSLLSDDAVYADDASSSALMAKIQAGVAAWQRERTRRRQESEKEILGSSSLQGPINWQSVSRRSSDFVDGLESSDW